ncbi:LysR family transcriptional regulator [Acinetobacter sichuanensis]|uniref:LysR family transcriptional regulator n=1 Tax=Acinetobacter sichuanensis TaxID=2136183 RepID=A0A371YPP1_9GAMM|nr:LysR family transcriptional regulator [Acinetobacter sichuanensis]RFC83450.1 LysR family transcriptional regulator [Acinetobacter sichuanensis]
MDIKRSEMSLMISLDTLLEEKNVTRAAKRLYLSQPALSAQLARLRQIFQDPLLVPSETGKGMIATKKAIELQPKLHLALQELQKAISFSIPFDPLQSNRHFVLAMNDSLLTIVGIGIIQKIFQTFAPNIRLSFIPVPEKQELLNRMEKGEIDLSIGLHDNIPVALHSRHLLSDYFQVAARIGHPQLNSNVITLQDYCQAYHVIFSKTGILQSSIDFALQKQGLQRNVITSVFSYNQIPLILLDTDSIATLPSRFLQRYQNILKVFEVPFELPRFDLAMAWHANMQEDPAHQWLRNLLYQVNHDSAQIQ